MRDQRRNGLEPPESTGTIQRMDEDRAIQAGETAERVALSEDRPRLEMMAREKRMSVEERVALFERMSRDAAWIRSSAKRVR